MSAQIIQFVPRPNPNRGAPTLEQQAIGIVDYINGLTAPEMLPYHQSLIEKVQYGGAGIDGMDVTQAGSFHAPDKDPA